MGENRDYAGLVNKAYDAVKGLDADDVYKIEGYKVVLQQLVQGGAIPSDEAPRKKTGSEHKAPRILTDDAEWVDKIAHNLELTTDQVTEIYYYDNDELKLIIDRKKLPDSASASTVDIAALIAAGRQSLGLDTAGTPYEYIKTALETLNCFNKKNWTGYIKKLGSRFLYEGSGSDSRLKLTNKAFEDAAAIAKKYITE